MLSLGNHPERNTTDTVHTSSFAYRATLLFASSADFDVCRPLVRSQIFVAYGTTTVRLIVICDVDQRRHIVPQRQSNPP
jgi:hypothetical protein